jgi:hypothetical protein
VFGRRWYRGWRDLLRFFFFKHTHRLSWLWQNRSGCSIGQTITISIHQLLERRRSCRLEREWQGIEVDQVLRGCLQVFAQLFGDWRFRGARWVGQVVRALLQCFVTNIDHIPEIWAATCKNWFMFVCLFVCFFCSFLLIFSISFFLQ